MNGSNVVELKAPAGDVLGELLSDRTRNAASRPHRPETPKGHKPAKVLQSETEWDFDDVAAVANTTQRHSIWPFSSGSSCSHAGMSRWPCKTRQTSM